MTHRRIYSIPLDKASHGRFTKLDCYDVISVAGELGIAIITLGKLHFLLSCRLTRTMSWPCSTNDVQQRGHMRLTGSHLH
jgi:hypothetical protein